MTNTWSNLEEGRDALHNVTDDLNAAIVRAEDAIAQLKLGVTANVLFVMDGDDPRVERRLWFGKMGDRWRFIVEVRGLHDSSNPLLNTSKLIRMHAPYLFDDLLKALLTEVGKNTKGIDDARARADAFTARVRNVKAAAE